MNTNTAKQHSLKIALIAAAVLGAASFGGAASAAVGNANATATVVIPITITKVTDLTFGKFLAGASTGTVDVDTNGARTFTGGTAGTAGGTVGAAKFDITGQASSTYSIAYSTGVTLVSGGNSMALTQVSDLSGAGGATTLAASGTLSAGGTQSVFIGGSLAVGINQAPGDYSGAITATVDYN